MLANKFPAYCRPNYFSVKSEFKRVFGLQRFSIDPVYVQHGSQQDAAARITLAKDISSDFSVTYSTNVFTVAGNDFAASLITKFKMLTDDDALEWISLLLKPSNRKMRLAIASLILLIVFFNNAKSFAQDVLAEFHT